MMDARHPTQALGGKWYRHYGSAPCPVCQPERRRGQNALTLADGDAGLLAHCKKSDCAFHDVLGAASVAPMAPGGYTPPDPAIRAQREADRKAEAPRRAKQAFHVWQEAESITGSVAETYLRQARGITCDLPETLRYHPACWHGATATRHPALVALIDGGAVRLSDEGGPLVLAEGIETALSLASGLLQCPATIWAALSTSGVRGLTLPSEMGRVTIAPDGDPAGRAAAHVLAERAHAAGWTVSTLPAPNGRDWNDILTMKGRNT